jgi:predicted nucleic acid-binding protein
MVIIDSNIIIDHIRQPKNSPTLLKTCLKQYKRTNLSITVITIQELFAGQSTRIASNQNIISKSLSGIKIFNFTQSIAKLAGELMRDSKNNLKFADAAIAATAIHYGASLATLNTKDFKGIPDLDLLPL